MYVVIWLETPNTSCRWMTMFWSWLMNLKPRDLLNIIYWICHEVLEGNWVIKMGSFALAVWKDWLKEWDVMKPWSRWWKYQTSSWWFSLHISTNLCDQLGFDFWPWLMNIKPRDLLNIIYWIRHEVFEGDWVLRWNPSPSAFDKIDSRNAMQWNL